MYRLIFQAQSVAHLGQRGMPIIWYPPVNPWDAPVGGSTMSLNHPQQVMWSYPMGYNTQQRLGSSRYSSAMSRGQSPARSVRTSRSRAVSPSPSLKSRKSMVSQSRSRRSPGSPSDASSEESDESSDMDDRRSRDSRNLKKGSVSRSQNRVYQEEDDNRSRLSKNRRG